MSQRQIEMVRAMQELWNTGEREPELSRYLDPEIELESPFSSVVGVPYRGYGGFEQWIRDVDEQFAEWAIAPDELCEAGERVLAVSTVTARARASGINTSFQAACVFEFAADGRVARMKIYMDIPEARRATGLP